MSLKLREHIEKITTLTDEEYAFILSHFTSKKLKKNEALIRAGENVDYSYFVVSGLIKVSHTDDAAKEHILQFAMEDWWTSDYQAYHNRTPAAMSLYCLEDTEVLCISQQNFEKLCGSLHKMEHFFRRKANFGYVALQQRILSLLTTSAKERYEQMLKQYPSLFQRVPKSLLASYLGVTRETLSRLSS